MKRKYKQFSLFVLRLFLILMGVWFLVVPSITMPGTLMGMVAALCIIFFVWRGSVLDAETVPSSFRIRFMLYVFFLLKEVVISNLLVVRMIFQKTPPRGRMFFVRLKKDDSLMRHVVLFFSITATPGTITVIDNLCVGKDKFIMVHALDGCFVQPESMDIMMDKIQKSVI